MGKLERIAVLDDQCRLVGFEEVPFHEVCEKDICCGDLPCDGSYRWTGDTFEPTSQALSKSGAAPIGRDRAMYLLAKSLLDEKPIPQECIDWCAWFEKRGK